MIHFKLLGAALLLASLFCLTLAGNFDDSSCESSEEYGGGKHKHRHHKHRPKPPRPPPRPHARPKCEQGWYTSYRPQGIWCLRVGIGKLDYHQSQAQCKTYGGVLSGLQNNFERQLIANETVRQLLPTGVTIAGVWLGASKVPGTNTFKWNDGHTTGTGGMFYGPEQPDNAKGDPRGPQNCLQLIVMTPAYWSHPDKWVPFVRLIDDYWCHMTHDPPQRLYASPRPRATCESGWLTSYRPQGLWCLKIGIGKLDYNQSQAQCETQGGVLSRIQNDLERQLIANETIRQLIPIGVTIAGVWLGASKVPGTNTFQWNDGHTTGTGGMFFGPGQPDNALRDPRGPQNCLQLIVMTPAFYSRPDKWITFPQLIDDYWCHMTHDPPQRLYACGKPGPVDNMVG
ncbi:hypothetical protein CRE_17481 [Caenorhabditis remanei]|uniref:C-type lectin domain-containing protein n=1 Tax=Caenorhabditis remanei TaxID=31234 RepID=E3N7U1_CAERE|nr:hypothetical protein CRE_17481 [Caenorhabditis remanei]